MAGLHVGWWTLTFQWLLSLIIKAEIVHCVEHFIRDFGDEAAQEDSRWGRGRSELHRGSCAGCSSSHSSARQMEGHSRGPEEPPNAPTHKVTSLHLDYTVNHIHIYGSDSQTLWLVFFAPDAYVYISMDFRPLNLNLFIEWTHQPIKTL